MNKQEIYEIILKLKEQKLTSPQIAIELNNKQIKTLKGLEWTANLVNDFCYKQKKNVKKLTNSDIKININSDTEELKTTQDSQQIVIENVTEKFTELDKANADKELANTQDSQQNVIEDVIDIQQIVLKDVIKNKSAVIDNVIENKSTVIESVIDTKSAVIDNVIENKSISFEKAYNTLIQHIDCLYQEIEILRNKIAVIENKSAIIDVIDMKQNVIDSVIDTHQNDIESVIENKSSVIEDVIENKSSVIDVIDNKIGKWSIQCSKGNYMAFKRINGKVKSIYIGKNINLAKQKIEAKGFRIE